MRDSATLNAFFVRFITGKLLSPALIYIQQAVNFPTQSTRALVKLRTQFGQLLWTQDHLVP